MHSYQYIIRMGLYLDFTRPGLARPPHPLTWKFLHAIDRTEVVLECTVAVHSHAEVELWHESKKRACPVTMLNGADAHSQQPVDILHLLLPRTQQSPVSSEHNYHQQETRSAVTLSH